MVLIFIEKMTREKDRDSIKGGKREASIFSLKMLLALPVLLVLAAGTEGDIHVPRAYCP
jgi:hypothetical protein